MFFKDKLKLTRLPVSRVLPNPSQPRKVFDQGELESLAQSIKENGLLQPVTVRRENGAYFLIAGERRLRACKLAGLREIPALVADCPPEDSAVLALLENIQRQDLQMFEQAAALQSLLGEWHITQEEAAKRLGISQSYLANKLRLLKLPPPLLERLRAAGLTERHARALLRLEDDDARSAALDHIIATGLTVAQTEAYIDALLSPASQKRRPTYLIRDVRLFLNTVSRAMKMMQGAGVPAQCDRQDTEDAVLLTIRIPK